MDAGSAPTVARVPARLALDAALVVAGDARHELLRGGFTLVLRLPLEGIRSIAAQRRCQPRTMEDVDAAVLSDAIAEAEIGWLPGLRIDRRLGVHRAVRGSGAPRPGRSRSDVRGPSYGRWKCATTSTHVLRTVSLMT